MQLNPLLNYENIQVEGFDDINLIFRITIFSIEHSEYNKTLDFSQKIERLQYQTGDVNGDNIINVLDIVQTIQIVLGLEDYKPEADLNGDGGVNILDIVILTNLILGQDNSGE